jgi:hypothetical protein
VYLRTGRSRDRRDGAAYLLLGVTSEVSIIRPENLISQPYYGMIITAPEPESLEAIRNGLREMGIDVATGPFLVDTTYQESLLPLSASLNAEQCQRNEEMVRGSLDLTDYGPTAS